MAITTRGAGAEVYSGTEDIHGLTFYVSFIGAEGMQACSSSSGASVRICESEKVRIGLFQPWHC